MPLPLDTRFLVEYVGHPGFHHERCLIMHVHGSHYISMTADGDIYMENYVPTEWLSIHKLDTDRLGRRTIPTGIEAEDCLWFEDGDAALLTPLSLQQRDAALAQAREMLPECRLELGLQVPTRRVRGKGPALPGAGQLVLSDGPHVVKDTVRLGATAGGAARPGIATPVFGDETPPYPKADPLDESGRWYFLKSGTGFVQSQLAHISKDFVFMGGFGVTRVSPQVTAPVEWLTTPPKPVPGPGALQADLDSGAPPHEG